MWQQKSKINSGLKRGFVFSYKPSPVVRVRISTNSSEPQAPYSLSLCCIEDMTLASTLSIPPGRKDRDSDEVYRASLVEIAHTFSMYLID